MKLALKIIAGIFGLFFLLAIVLGTIANRADGPRQSVKLLNTSESVRSVTFAEYRGDSTGGYVINESLEPGKTIIKRAPEGNYKVEVWDAEDFLIDEVDYEIVLPNEKKSNYTLLRFDLAMDKRFSVVNCNALYEGGDFAEHMSTAMGTNKSGLTVADAYSGGAPFFVQEQYADRLTFIDVDGSVPRKISYGETVYCLIPTLDSLSDDTRSLDLYQEVLKKFE